MVMGMHWMSEVMVRMVIHGMGYTVVIIHVAHIVLVGRLYCVNKVSVDDRIKTMKEGGSKTDPFLREDKLLAADVNLCISLEATLATTIQTENLTATLRRARDSHKYSLSDKHSSMSSHMS